MRAPGMMRGMGNQIKYAAWYFLIEAFLPSVYFLVTDGPATALACLKVTLIIFALSVAVIVAAMPLLILVRNYMGGPPKPDDYGGFERFWE
jgi:hypothetical protein